MEIKTGIGSVAGKVLMTRFRTENGYFSVDPFNLKLIETSLCARKLHLPVRGESPEIHGLLLGYDCLLIHFVQQFPNADWAKTYYERLGELNPQNSFNISGFFDKEKLVGIGYRTLR